MNTRYFFFPLVLAILVLVTVLGLSFLGGCADDPLAEPWPGQYGTKPTPVEYDLADINGEFMLSINLLGSGMYVHYIADVVLHDDTVDLKLRPLDQNMEALPSATSWTGLSVFYRHEYEPYFTIPLDSMIILDQANPLLNHDATINGKFSVTILSADFWCGTVTGQLVETGTLLDGSTFGAQRLVAGTLPSPTGSCEDEPTEPVDAPDAGVPDATPDASTPVDGPYSEPDAMPDATEPDAHESPEAM